MSKRTKNKSTKSCFMSKKQYQEKLKKTYKEQDINKFKKKVNEFYSESKLSNMCKEERLVELLCKEKKHIENWSLVISSLLSALATSIINSDYIKIGLKENFIITFIIVLFFTILGSLILFGFTFGVLWILQETLKLVSDEDIEKKNIETDVIIDMLSKKSLKNIIRRDIKNKWKKNLVYSTFVGLIVAVIATVIVWFTP